MVLEEIGLPVFDISERDKDYKSPEDFLGMGKQINHQIRIPYAGAFRARIGYKID
jgi:hypothetical protein